MKNNSTKPKKRIDLAISWTRLIQIVASLAFFLFILPVSISAQNDNYIQSNASLAEKVYLQLDGKVYTTGSIVWFNSIVSNATNHVPSLLSGVLHVELIGPTDDQTCLVTF